MTAKNTPLADHAARLKAELDATQLVQKKLAELREVFAEFPQLRTAFGDELALLAGKTAAVWPSAPSVVNGSSRTVTLATPTNLGLPNVERIVRFLKSHKEPATADEIADATRVPINSVRHTLYTRHTERFQQVERSGRKTYWTLKEEDQKTTSPPKDRG